MNGVLVDTGPLYAAYDLSDRYHLQAQTEIQAVNQQNLAVFLSYPVFLESHNLILKRLGIVAGLRFIQEMTEGTMLIQPIAEDYQAASQLLRQYPDQAITLCDATTAAISKRLSLPVWTYDFHFDVMGSQVWR
ncbi:type II toxin-antitoxin system VapC family toxin [Egbenema bharatensis]|uniref:type II toxin-antitoxin system VapC family toxin n=1 Tax=Egbenema bharatensis TaxID=3463334 RepID=UPI003A884D78